MQGGHPCSAHITSFRQSSDLSHVRHSGRNGRRMLLSLSHAQVSAWPCNNKEAPPLRPPHVHRRLVSWGPFRGGPTAARRAAALCFHPGVLYRVSRLTKSQETRNKLSRQTARTHTGLMRREDRGLVGSGRRGNEKSSRPLLYEYRPSRFFSVYIVPRVPYEKPRLSLSIRITVPRPR